MVAALERAGGAILDVVFSCYGGRWNLKVNQGCRGQCTNGPLTSSRRPEEVLQFCLPPLKAHVETAEVGGASHGAGHVVEGDLLKWTWRL